MERFNKKFLVLFALILISGIMLTGCAGLVSSLTEYLRGNTTATGTDSGRIISPVGVLSGTISREGTLVKISLNSVIVSGEAKTFTSAGAFKVFLGVSPDAYSTFLPVSATVFTTSESAFNKVDLVFIMDNTGSMSGRIKAVKDSIAAFATNIESAGWDVKFGVVSYGDNLAEQSALALPSNAAAVSSWLNSLTGVGGGDIPENPLDSIMYANNNFVWRSTARKIFIVITDATAHQIGTGDTGYNNNATTTLSAVLATLEGNATVYGVTPKLNSSSSPNGYTGTADVRWLVDGYGWFSGVSSSTYGTVKPYSGTGGRWIELPSTGNIDLNTLGIYSTVVKGFTITFTSALSPIYVHILVDINGDGLYEVDGVFSTTVSASSVGKWLPSGELSDPSDAAMPGKNN